MENTEVITLLKDSFELKRQGKYKRAVELLYKALSICPDDADILLQVADLHVLLDNPTTVCSIYEKLIEQNNSNELVLEKLVDYYLSVFNYDKARVLLAKFTLAYPSAKAYEIYLKALFVMKDNEKIIELYKDMRLERFDAVDVNKFYGMALCRLKQYEEAKSILETVYNGCNNEEVAFYYAQTLYSLGDSKKAWEIASLFIQNAQEPGIYNICGEIELSTGHYEQAINLFSQALKIKSDALYFYNLGCAYFLNGQISESKNVYTKAISASPDTDEYRYAQAYLYFKTMEYEKAENLLNVILNRNESFNAAILLKAEIDCVQSKFYRAEKNLEKYNSEAKDKDENYLKLYAKVTKSLYKLRHSQKALEKLIQLKPGNTDYLYDFALVSFELSDYGKASESIDKILVKLPNYVPAYILLAKIYLKNNEYEKVLTLTEKILSLDLNNEEGFYLKALANISIGNYDEAISLLKTLLNYNPQRADAYALIGESFRLKEDYKTAIDYYNEAVTIDSKNPDYFVNLAVLNKQIDNMKETLRYLFVAHSLKPTSKEIVSLLCDLYVEQNLYKLAYKLLKKQLIFIKQYDEQKAYKEKMQEIDELYKESVNIFKYAFWKLFRI